MSDVPSNLIPTRVTQLPTAPVADENSLMMIVYQGNNYQIRVGDLLSVAGVPTSRQVIAGTGLTGGGQLSSNVTLSVAPGGIGTTQLAATGVTPGTYGDATNIPVFIVDATGRVTAATTVPASGGGGVPTSTEVIAGTGLNGGGALTGNVTINANLSNATPLAVDTTGSAGVSNNIARADHQHPAIDLADDNQVDGLLGLDNGGTARSLVANEGAIVWSGADGLYIGPAGVAGQVLLSGGLGEYTWSDQQNLDVGQADNINGGSANQVLYQTGADTTGFVPAPTISNTVLYWNGTDLVWGTVPGTGTVISVGLAMPSDFTVTNSPVTVSGTLTADWAAQNPNLVFAGPGTGATPATPSFRSLNNTDIPSALSGKTINASAIGNTTPSTGVFTTVDALDVTASLVDATNVEVTNIKAKDGTASATIADATGVMTINSSVLTTTDINGGTIDNTVIGATTPVAGSFTNLAAERIDMDTTPPAQTDAEGRMYWNDADNAKTLNIGMAGGAAVLQVGQETYYRVKASAAILNGQAVMFTGTVGASGGLTAAPATGLTDATATYFMGVATEDIDLNNWGYVTEFGLVRGINTTGGAEAWVDGQILYYDPTVPGGLTKTVPAAPAAKIQVAAVVYAASNGSLFVRPQISTSLEDLNDVETSTPTTGDVLVYNAGNYWTHVAQSNLNVGSATTATNIAGGAAGSIPYQTGSGSTSLLAAGTGVLVGGSTPSYTTTPTLTGTNFSAIPNAALSNSSVTIGSTNIALGATSLTLAGLDSVTLTGDPTLALQATTKQYVDALIASGIHFHTPVRVESPTNLNATYNNGTSGVGATLTNAGTQAALVIDGVAVNVADRVLVYQQTDQTQNGIYVVTDVGSGSTNWILTRSSDADTYVINDANGLSQGSTVFVQQGTTGAGETYTCNTTGTITFGTTNITFAQISTAQIYSAGTGLTLTGTQFALDTPVSLANGGSGQTSAQAAMNAYAGAVTSGQYLRGNGTNVVMSAIQAADVPTLNQNTTGQAGSVANAVTFNTTGGAAAGSTFDGSAARTVDYSTVGAPKADGTGASGTWNISISGTAATATSATTATNLGGGAPSQIPYQTGAGATSFIANGTAGQVLLSNGTGAPSWSNMDGGTF